MAGLLIRSSILDGSAALIRARGARPAVVARRAGLPLRAFTDPGLLVSGTAVLRAFEFAAQECGDRTWGLSLSTHARLAAIIGPLWILLRNARTVGQMCEAFAHNFDVFSDVAVVTARPQDGGGLLLSWNMAATSIQSHVQMLEFALSVFTQEIRTHLGAQWAPAAVLFTHARPPGSLKLYRAMFGRDPRFNQAWTGLLLDRDTVEQPLRGRQSAARALASRVVELEERTSEKAIGRQVEAVIRGLMPYAPCSLRDVSQAMGVGPRTLQIRLKRHGETFAAIRDAVRADLASKYLRHSDLPAGRIAEILGYGDVTSLSRSFRRWQGRTMRHFRAAKS
ncbi:AraC family transcriptional regulator ligand-binding domain-containing protein [Panacagrimonas sp.]|uniref:AraC family transcriptional regulator n=1 Tax=Panacagrimonas sp. TaxID=2480088 RepID=UPI003B5175BA